MNLERHRFICRPGNITCMITSCLHLMNDFVAFAVDCFIYLSVLRSEKGTVERALPSTVLNFSKSVL